MKLTWVHWVIIAAVVGAVLFVFRAKLSGIFSKVRNIL